MPSVNARADLRDAIRAKQEELAKKIGFQDLIYATLYEVDGSVRVAVTTLTPQTVYYIPEAGGDVDVAFNREVMEQAGLPVVIGIREGQKEKEVLWLDWARIVSENIPLNSPKLSQHWIDHDYLGGDPARIDPRVIKDMRVYPEVGTLKVNVGPGNYDHLGTARYFNGRFKFDLSSYQPVDTGVKVGVGLYLDKDNALQATQGASTSINSLIPEPAWPGDAFLLAVVVLYEEKSYIDWEDIKLRKRIWSSTPRTILQMQGFS